VPRSHARDETSAGGVVFRMDAGQPLYLLIRDSYKNWGFPKGHVESGEQAEAYVFGSTMHRRPTGTCSPPGISARW